jgi:hypothetical protein
VQNFESHLEDYLRNTGKEELSPEGIKRDLQLLLNDPRAGAESLGDRLAHFDRSTLISLLQMREDISEQEATRIVDQVLSVRDSLLNKFELSSAAFKTWLMACLVELEAISPSTDLNLIMTALGKMSASCFMTPGWV